MKAAPMEGTILHLPGCAGVHVTSCAICKGRGSGRVASACAMVATVTSGLFHARPTIAPEGGARDLRDTRDRAHRWPERDCGLAAIANGIAAVMKKPRAFAAEHSPWRSVRHTMRWGMIDRQTKPVCGQPTDQEHCGLSRRAGRAGKACSGARHPDRAGHDG